ncbi:MAG: Hsp20/alpha crystallin family protein [Candidatus Marinimicrobia bacterium]|nr:Hsp20/alpha crystallin family protein [Candidatus Neomarinimicrobiota bacterium]
MKQNRVTIIIGLILVLAVAIEGFYLYDLGKQINDDKKAKQDSVNISDAQREWFSRNGDDLFDLFSGLDNMQRDMDQLFGHFALNFKGKPYFDSVFGDFRASPALDIKEEADKYLIEVELPGTENNSINVSVENNMLNIQAETVQEKESDKSDYKRSERYSGKLQRYVSIPEDADAASMTTVLKDGILIITLPKKA